MNRAIQKGGYSILNLRDVSDNLYENAKALIGFDKPILCYLADGQAIFADEIKLDNGNVLINIGGRTYTIADTNEVTYEGDIQVDMSQYVKITDAKKYYIHSFRCYSNQSSVGYSVKFDLITDSDTSIINQDDVKSILINMGLQAGIVDIGARPWRTASGYYFLSSVDSSKKMPILGVGVSNGGSLVFYYYNHVNNGLSEFTLASGITFTDTIAQI